ncbi:MAG: hypothetical protein RRC34_04705 [Lentisphaeria bacterium]|nr:hypothetical protein [Lentisphaeria bacterium]
MKRDLSIVLMLASSLLLNTGHAFLFPGGVKRAAASRLAVVYHPFPKPSPHGWEALPTTNGLWTKERMLRDIKRLKKMNVSITLLVLTPERFSSSSPYLSEDCQTFTQLCEAEGITVSPMISATTVISKRDQSLISQFIRDVWVQNDTGTERPDRALCFLAGEAVTWRVRDPAIQYVNVPASDAGASVVINNQTWLFTAVPGKTEPAPSARDREKSLKAGLNAVSKRSVPVAVLCLNAWNDYGGSHVVEPNTFDGDTLYDRLSTWAGKYISKP